MSPPVVWEGEAPRFQKDVIETRHERAARKSPLDPRVQVEMMKEEIMDVIEKMKGHLVVSKIARLCDD